MLNLAKDLKDNPGDWNGFGYLNSNNPQDWERMLYKVIGLKPSGWDAQYSKVVVVAKALAKNWQSEIPEILAQLSSHDIDIEDFFQLERTITFKLAALLSDTNELHRIIVNPAVDIGGFIGRLSNAFLPPAVYHLEEYGLPRMISRKIHRAGVVDFAASGLDLRGALNLLRSRGLEEILKIETLSPFDKYVVRFFFDGISPDEATSTALQNRA